MDTAIYILLALNSLGIIYLLFRKSVSLDKLTVKKFLSVEGFFSERPLHEDFKCTDGHPAGVGSFFIIGNPAMTRGRAWVRGMGDDTRQGWLGADGDGSFRMPDGKWCWLFGDTFIGTVARKSLFYAHREPESMHTAHNSLAMVSFADLDGHRIPSGITYYAGAFKKNQRYPGWDPYVQGTADDNCFSWLTPENAHQGLAYWPKAGTDMHDGNKGILLFCYLIKSSVFVRNDMFYVPAASEENITGWDRSAVRKPLPEVMQQTNGDGSAGIGWMRVTQLGHGEILLQGWEQKPISPKLFLARGKPKDFFHNFEDVFLWSVREGDTAPGWHKGCTAASTRLSPVKMKTHDRRPTCLFSGSTTSDIYKSDDRWCFLALNGFSSALFDNGAGTKGWVLERFATKRGCGPQGPYYKEKRHIHRLPSWTWDLDRWTVYALRSHPELTSSLLTPEEDLSQKGYELENVVSWIAQPWFPYWSAAMFSPELIYKAYQPQLIFVWKKKAS